MLRVGRIFLAACWLAVGCATAQAQESPQNQIEATVAANTLSVEAGQTLHITGMATASTTEWNKTIVIEVLLHGQVITSRVFRDVTLKAYQPMTVTLNWKVPTAAAPGNYTIEMGVRNWHGLLLARDRTGLRVTAPAPPGSPPRPSTGSRSGSTGTPTGAGGSTSLASAGARMIGR